MLKYIMVMTMEIQNTIVDILNLSDALIFTRIGTGFEFSSCATGPGFKVYLGQKII